MALLLMLAIWLLPMVGLLVVGLFLVHVARWSARDTVGPECLRCGYNLTGVASPICPECGLPRDQPIESRYRRKRRPIVLAIGILLLGLMPIQPIVCFPGFPPLFVNRGPHYSHFSQGTQYLTWEMAERLFDGQPVDEACPWRDFETCREYFAEGYHSVLRDAAYMPAIRREAALAQWRIARSYFYREVEPAYETALGARRTQDAEALGYAMRNLDREMRYFLGIWIGGPPLWHPDFKQLLEHDWKRMENR